MDFLPQGFELTGKDCPGKGMPSRAMDFRNESMACKEANLFE
jgi:hypothetical protein